MLLSFEARPFNPGISVRVFAISDLHVDHVENLERLGELLQADDYRDDLLIIAGDVTHRLSLLKATLQLVKTRFGRVVYVPGNHETWTSAEHGDSLHKLGVIHE